MKAKITSILISVIIILLLVLPSFAASEVIWDTTSIETVLTPGSGTWESVAVWYPNVMYDDGIYKMWYAGTTGRDGEGERGLGYAESSDGVNWTNWQLVYGPTNGYAQVDSPYVIKEGDTYKMWFREYYENIGSQWSGYVSYMTSTDGIIWSNKQKVMSAQGQTDVPNGDGYNITNLSVLKEGGQYTMWYAVDDLGPVEYHTWRATSSDGINWGNRQLSLPYIDGAWGAYDPNVTRDIDGNYTIYFTTGYPSMPEPGGQLNFAISNDGISWDNRQPIGVDGHSPFYFEDIEGTPYLYFSNSGNIFRMRGTIVPPSIDTPG